MCIRDRKIWYEGYDSPKWLWQSVGGTDDYESKLSLRPLFFGTLKGTLYALVFAVPVAVMAAIYKMCIRDRPRTGQFLCYQPG